MKSIYVCSTLMFLAFIFCGCYGTKFANLSNQNYPPKPVPCEVRVIAVLPSSIDSLERIGICKSRKMAGRVKVGKNRAMESLLKCACEHGGDLMRVFNHKEYVETPNDPLNPPAAPPKYLQTRVLDDELYGEVYRKIN